MYELFHALSLYLADSIAGGIYTHRFLKGRYSKKLSPFAWAALYFIANCLVLEPLSGTYPFNELVIVIANIAVVFLLQLLLYKEEPLKQVFVAVSFVAGRNIIRYIIIVMNSSLYNLIYDISSDYISHIESVEEAERWFFFTNVIIWTALIIVYSLLLTAYFSLLSKKFTRKDYRFQPHEYAFLILPNVAILCISITLQMLVVSVENEITVVIFDKVPATMFWIPLICVLLLGVNISSVILFQKLVQLGEEKRKRSLLENQVTQMQREIEEIQDIYSDMRGLRHDMRSHLESIAAVIGRTAGKDKEELDGYIGQMEKTVSRLDFAYKTGNPITDVIIHQKKQEAEKRQITLEVDFTYPDKQQIDVYDIGIVLNNALENAIEASSKVDKNKAISLRSYMKGNLFFIEVENDFCGELVIDSVTGLPVSSKEDRQNHGLGIENIQRCAKKYMGDIDISTREKNGLKRFCLTVMMYERYFTPEKA
ncbi:MAG: GHKL domain-containing protein [Oscillospiraceae bacterium]|nr:GHKL domain-containing protein [Oscillospiraceae bacterium]